MGLFDFFKKKKKKKECEIVAETAKENINNTCESDIKEIEYNAQQSDVTEASEPIENNNNNLTSNEIVSNEDIQEDISQNDESLSETDDTNQINTVIEEPLPKQKEAYTGKFEINKSKDGKKFFFNLYASNKVGIATSQMYSSAQSALNGVKSVIVNAPNAPIEDQSLKNYETLPYPKWEIYIDNGGKYRFRLNASNGSCVCHSQGYTTKSACKNGIDSIIRSSKNAEIGKTYIK